MRTLFGFLGLTYFCVTAFAQDGPGPKVRRRTWNVNLDVMQWGSSRYADRVVHVI